MKTFLFQGDSITDCERSRQNDTNMGYGYPTLAAAKLSFRYPGEFNFVNRGVGGDRSTSLYARCSKEMVECNPDYMSILIGVNDVWHGLYNGTGVHPDRYEQILTMQIEDALQAFPNVKIVVLEPFVLNGSATNEKWDRFHTGVLAVAQKAREVAERFGLLFIPLQEKFNALSTQTSPDCWLVDGVHPTYAGHELIASELLKGLNL